MKNQKTDNFIMYIISNISIPTGSVISKICYLCDYIAAKKLGSTISDIKYEKDYSGIVGKRIDDCLNDLVYKKHIGASIEYTTGGAEYVRYFIPSEKQEFEKMTELFSYEEKEVIDEVLKSVGTLNAKMLNSVTEKTEPVKSAEKAESKVELRMPTAA